MRSLTPAQALLPLRAFLGATFVYAGIQKLSDPGFLHPGASTYIGTQLHGFARGTPGGALLRMFALPHPQLAGIAVALTEIAVGLLVLIGLGTRIAAAVGLSLNLVLFLSASWKTSPYFLGSDIVFVFAWLPFVLAGSAGQPAVERLPGPDDVSAARRWRPATRPSRASSPAGSGALYTDPVDGQTDILVRQASGTLSACSAICTHAGCRVEYTKGELYCPCHGSAFDVRTGVVKQGPATQPLAVKRVIERGGSIYALPS